MSFCCLSAECRSAKCRYSECRGARKFSLTENKFLMVGMFKKVRYEQNWVEQGMALLNPVDRKRYVWEGYKYFVNFKLFYFELYFIMNYIKILNISYIRY